MRVSIIIPVKPGGLVRALEPLEQLHPGSPDFEIIVAEGKKPSLQRNRGAEAAEGDILYFLDDDSLVQPDALLRLEQLFADPNVAVIGGPSVTPKSDTAFQRSVGWALASLFGGGAIRNRYRRSGKVRETGDNELILCNLAFRKEQYLAAGGLNEKLYPNEENELIDRFLASGARLLHDPDLFVTRSQRPSLKAYVRQMLTYGRGRAEQTLLTRAIGFKALLPALFALYILSLPFSPGVWYLLPLFLYLAAIVANMATAAAVAGISPALRLPLVYFLLHFCYGAGFIAGLFQPRYRRGSDAEQPVTLRWIREFARHR
jgi:glycosyltransferase involved in cell wall biosynthesis